MFGGNAFSPNSGKIEDEHSEIGHMADTIRSFDDGGETQVQVRT
jgi:hypothetical protein